MQLKYCHSCVVVFVASAAAVNYENDYDDGGNNDEFNDDEDNDNDDDDDDDDNDDDDNDEKRINYYKGVNCIKN